MMKTNSEPHLEKVKGVITVANTYQVHLSAYCVPGFLLGALDPKLSQQSYRMQ